MDGAGHAALPGRLADVVFGHADVAGVDLDADRMASRGETAATPVLPVPANGSSTMSPANENIRISRSASFGG